MEIRMAYPNEIQRIMEIIQDAKESLEQRKVDQWQDGYPNEDIIFEDILESRGYMYITFHRVAVAKEAAGKGVAQTFLQGLIEGEKGPDFRCDTHPDNLVMQHLLEKLGYHYCGKVPIDGVRLAYQKIKRKAENSLFQVVSEEDRWDQRAEAASNDSLS